MLLPMPGRRASFWLGRCIGTHPVPVRRISLECNVPCQCRHEMAIQKPAVCVTYVRQAEAVCQRAVRQLWRRTVLNGLCAKRAVCRRTCVPTGCVPTVATDCIERAVCQTWAVYRKGCVLTGCVPEQTGAQLSMSFRVALGAQPTDRGKTGGRAVVEVLRLAPLGHPAKSPPSYQSWVRPLVEVMSGAARVNQGEFGVKQGLLCVQLSE